MIDTTNFDCEEDRIVTDQIVIRDGHGRRSHNLFGCRRSRSLVALRVPGEEAMRRDHGELVAIRTDRGEREALMHQDPETFFITPHWESNPSVLVWLATVETEQLRELLTDAWRARAPKRLIRELEEG